MAAPAWLVEDLIPDEGVALWHGQPRDLKSFTALSVGFSIAAGQDALGSPRFAVRRAATVAYVTEEDPERTINRRLGWFLEGGIVPEKNRFFLLVRRSLNLDEPRAQNRFISWLDENGVEVLFLDPLRSFTASSDKGPADFAGMTRFLRRIQNETNCKAIVIIHHDVKPSRDSRYSGNRRRSHDASGGGVFSVADCPVSFEKTDWNRVAVRPEDYKAGSDPKPFEVHLQSDTSYTPSGAPRFGTWIHPVAETREPADLGVPTAREKIREYLRKLAEDSMDGPGAWASTQEVESGASVDKNQVRRALADLLAVGLVEMVTGPAAKALGRSARANLWRDSGGLPRHEVHPDSDHSLQSPQTPLRESPTGAEPPLPDSLHPLKQGVGKGVAPLPPDMSNPEHNSLEERQGVPPPVSSTTSADRAGGRECGDGEGPGWVGEAARLNDPDRWPEDDGKRPGPIRRRAPSEGAAGLSAAEGAPRDVHRP
jgi:hypothetical protein